MVCVFNPGVLYQIKDVHSFSLGQLMDSHSVCVLYIGFTFSCIYLYLRVNNHKELLVPSGVNLQSHGIDLKVSCFIIMCQGQEYNILLAHT